MGWIHIWIVYSVTLTLTLHMCIMRTTSLLVITSFDHFSDRNNLHDGSAERRTVRAGWERSCEITELTLPHILIYTQKAHAKATIPVPRKHWLCNFLSSATVPDTREGSHLLCISFSVWKTCELLYLNKMWVQQPLQHTQKNQKPVFVSIFVICGKLHKSTIFTKCSWLFTWENCNLKSIDKLLF